MRCSQGGMHGCGQYIEGWQGEWWVKAPTLVLFIACDFSGIHGRGRLSSMNEKRLDTIGAPSIVFRG